MAIPINHRKLLPISILLSSVGGIGGSLITNSPEEEKTIKQPAQEEVNKPEESPVEIETIEEQEKEKPAEDPVPPEESTQVVIQQVQPEEPPKPEAKTEVEEEIVTLVVDGRIQTTEEQEKRFKRDQDDENFSNKGGAFTYTGGTRTFSQEQITTAKEKFKKHIVSVTQEKWNLIEYEDYQGWRSKTAQIMRSDLHTPKSMIDDIENNMEIDTEEGKEELAWKLRDKCYGAGDYLDQKEKLVEEFETATIYDGTEILNLCSFIEPD